MASDNKISMPGAFGGLMRYDEEYSSRFMLKPEHVIILIIAIIVVVGFFKIFRPLL